MAETRNKSIPWTAIAVIHTGFVNPAAATRATA
jgi:hypothetical protein